MKHAKHAMPYLGYRWLVMGKSPEPGKVKTRLQPYLTPEASADLQAALSRNVLVQWQAAKLCPLHFWVGGDMALFQQRVLGEMAVECDVSPQVEGHLGQRMATAIMAAFDQGSQGVIVTGTDCPFIDATYLEQALQALEQGADVVIGPADDGGYVLIGMNMLYPELFKGIPWGKETVLTATRQRIEASGLKATYLASLPDIDRPKDLPELGRCSSAILRTMSSLYVK
jgi:rSAM/selenodomain-associated transferase 1